MKFNEWLLENHPEQLLDENVLTDIASRLAKKYMLPATIVFALISGQGCKNQNSCPTPEVQQQIKQDVQKEIKSQKWTSPDAAKFVEPGEEDHNYTAPNAGKFVDNPSVQSQDIVKIGANTYQVKGFGKNSKFVNPHESAKRDAKIKLLKYLKINNANFSGMETKNVEKIPQGLFVTYQITIRQ